ncbi:hypothetical protein RFI_12076, partial [Reticulomyxa filosa]
VDNVIARYEPTQKILAGLNALTRWGENTLVSRSKFLIDFFWQQSNTNDVLRSAQVHEAFMHTPFPLTVALLHKYPQYDALVLRYLQKICEKNPKYIIHHAKIYGKKLMLSLLEYLKHVYQSLPENRSSANNVTFIDKEITQLINSDDLQPLPVNPLSKPNAVVVDSTNEFDIDEIRTIVTSNVLSDLVILEKKA